MVGRRGRFCSYKDGLVRVLGGGLGRRRAEGHVVPEEAQGENCEGKGVAGVEGVAIEKAGEGFVVVFCNGLGLVRGDGCVVCG